MAKINDTITFPNTTPATGDHVIGTDVSNTSNSTDGEVVTFTWGDVFTLAKASGVGGWEYVETITDASGLFTPTATFESGWRYRFECVNMIPSGGSSRFMYIQAQKASDDSWVGSGASTSGGVFTATDLTSSDVINAIIEVMNPGLSADTHLISFVSSENAHNAGSDAFSTLSTNSVSQIVSVGFASATTVKRIRIGSSSGGFAAGDIVKLYRQPVTLS